MESILDTQEDLNVPESRKRALYDAFSACDTRFDGQVFVGVSSTGIYCRPVCSAHMPKYENCTFFSTAAEAESAGYRPCLLCRPETAPGHSWVDARENLARRATVYLRENCTSGLSIETLANRLGYTDRHLRRVFEEEFHVTPVQYLQTCRLLFAKQLLTDSDLPISQVALASGFGSVRRFNQLFKERYHLVPTELRKARRKRISPKTAGPDGTFPSVISVKLSYRPPYNFSDLLAFFRSRQIAHVERVEKGWYARTVRIVKDDGEVYGWFRVEDNPRSNALLLTISESLLPVLSQVISRVRRQFDTDCDPELIAERISSVEDVCPGARVPGTRIPGCFDPFETACRAVLGQQVSVKAANRFAERIAENLGTPVETGIEGLDRSFPTPRDMLSYDNLRDTLGPLGVIGVRSQTIASIAQALVEGELDFSSGAPIAEQIERLLAIKGIGPWSANYIAMRVLGYTDAFLETDAGIRHALPGRSASELLDLAEQWRPWRSYANVCLWNSLPD